MSTPKSFNQVKSLLNRMDRSIDEARGKRLGAPIVAPERPAASAVSAPGPVGFDTVIGATEAAPEAVLRNAPASRAEPVAPAEPVAAPRPAGGASPTSARPRSMTTVDQATASREKPNYGRARPLGRSAEPLPPTGPWLRQG